MEIIIIAITVIVIFLAILLFLPKKKNRIENSSSSKSSKKVNNKSNNSSDKMRREDVFKFMEFDSVMDNMIIQNNGQRFTMAIKCKGINYDLMSEVEQMSVEQGFITFLNTLKYPIQLYVQAQNIDLKNVVKGYRQRMVSVEEEYNKYNKMLEEKSGIFDVDKEEIQEIMRERTRLGNVYEYANDIINYVDKMSINKNLLQRNFYVLVSYSKSEITAVDKFSKEEVDDMCHAELLTRCNSIISALSSSSVVGKVLDSNELADLLYVAYNRDDKSLIGVREALDSNIFRLYSTSKDAFTKKNDLLDEAIQEQSRLKALVALQKAVLSGDYQTDSMMEIENEEQTTKGATELLEADNTIDSGIKNKAYNIIMNEYREEKKELTKKAEEEKKEILEDAKNEQEELEEKYNNSELKKINDRKEEVINLYNEEIKKEKEELKKTIEENSNNSIEDDEGNDSIV